MSVSEVTNASRGEGPFGREVALSLLFFAGMLVASFGNNVLIARIAGTEGRGLYALAVSMNALAVPALSCGLGQSATHYLGRGVHPAAIASLSFAAFVVALVLCSLGLWVYVGPGGAISEDPMLLALVASIAVGPIAAYINTVRGFYLGMRRIVAFNVTQVAIVVLMLGLHWFILPLGPALVLVSFVASHWVVGLFLLATQLLYHVGRRLPSREELRGTLSYGVRSVGIALAEAGLLRLDYLLMAPIVGVPNAAIYAIADQMTHLAAAPGLQAGRIMLTESSHDSEGSGARRNLGVSVRLMTAFAVLAAIGASSTFWFLLPAIFGESFSEAYVGVLLLLPCTFLRGNHALISQYLAGKGLQRPAVVSSAAAICVNVPLVLLAAPLWGWFGVALARTIACAMQFGLVYIALRRLDAPLQWMPRRGDISVFLRSVTHRGQ